ncbi:MAG: DNA replication/repair protein RecF [Bacteroidales bacterium]
MILKKITILKFKNVENFEEEFSSKINCFIGNNGVGKTNILDAIHYLAFTKSFFNISDQISIKHGEKFFAIHGEFDNNLDIDKVSCILELNKNKKVIFNDKKYQKLSDHIGKIPLIMISPYDRDLINLGSDIRRKFADMIISQFDAKYLNSLISYNKLIQQRNKLLKQLFEQSSKDTSIIKLFDNQLADYGDSIFNKRKEFLDEFTPIFKHYYKMLSSGNETVNLKYESQLTEDNLLNLLNNSIERDLILKYTSNGIHKDDILFFINDFNAKNYASQGQQKTYTIALKLAQFEYIKEKSKKTPILLLDDIFDKLDLHRATNIIKLVSTGDFGQVFITDTSTNRLSNLFKELNLTNSTKIFYIK